MRIMLILAGLLACTPGVSEECAAKVAAARTLFAHGGEVAVLFAQPGMQLAESSHGAAIEDGIPVYVREDGSFLVDLRTPLPTVAAAHEALQEELDKAMTLAENTGQPWSQRLLLVPDARAPASAILDLAALLPPTLRLIVIVDLTGDVVPPAPPMSDAVKAATESPFPERTYRTADLLTPAIGTCAPVREVFDAVTTTTSDLRGKTLLDGLPGAIERCGCQGVDVDTLVSAAWAMVGKHQPSKRGLALPLSREPGAELVELPANARTSDLVLMIEKRDGKPFRVTPAP